MSLRVSLAPSPGGKIPRTMPEFLIKLVGNTELATAHSFTITRPSKAAIELYAPSAEELSRWLQACERTGALGVAIIDAAPFSQQQQLFDGSLPPLAPAPPPPSHAPPPAPYGQYPGSAGASGPAPAPAPAPAPGSGPSGGSGPGTGTGAGTGTAAGAVQPSGTAGSLYGSSMPPPAAAAAPSPLYSNSLYSTPQEPRPATVSSLYSTPQAQPQTQTQAQPLPPWSSTSASTSAAPPPPAASSEFVTVPLTSQASSVATTCASCHANLKPNARFCPLCGASVVA